MGMRKTFIAACLGLFGLCACNPNYDIPGMFKGTSPKVDTRFGESAAYNDSVGARHVQVETDYRVYVCTDSHIDSTHRNLQHIMETYAEDTVARLVIHLGDLINAQDNYEHAVSVVRNTLESGGRDMAEFFLTPGNHDIYFNQWHIFRTYFGTATYWFDTQDKEGNMLDLFICLDSAEGTLGTEQLDWLRTLLAEKAEQGYRHTIVFTHTHMFKQDNSQGHTSNYSVEETYELTHLLGSSGVDMYWCGHDHSREVTRYAGTEYIIVDSCQDPAESPYYMVVDMGNEIRYRFVPLK